MYLSKRFLAARRQSDWYLFLIVCLNALFKPKFKKEYSHTILVSFLISATTRKKNAEIFTRILITYIIQLLFRLMFVCFFAMCPYGVLMYRLMKRAESGGEPLDIIIIISPISSTAGRRLPSTSNHANPQYQM